MLKGQMTYVKYNFLMEQKEWLTNDKYFVRVQQNFGMGTIYVKDVNMAHAKTDI